MMFLDVENKHINGCTNICLVPHFSTLHDIRLNCRQCEVTAVYVNDVCDVLVKVSCLGSCSFFFFFFYGQSGL